MDWCQRSRTVSIAPRRPRPNPGAPALHRLNRSEYANAIRDLLALPVDPATLLPADDSSEGFDNMASVLGVSPALMQAYVSAAAKISRLAVGDPTTTASMTTYPAPRGISQTGHREGLPLGTRGGILVQHVFPLDAEYELRVARGGAGFGLSAVGCRRAGRDHARRRTRAPDRTRQSARRWATEDHRGATHHRRRRRAQDQWVWRGRSRSRSWRSAPASGA